MGKLIAGSLVGGLAALMLASSAIGASHSPKGEYSQFAECPLSRTVVSDCIFSVTNGGSFTVGERTVPIKNPVTLQGGFDGEGEEIDFFGAENGETLSKTPQPVPGGLVGVTAPSSWPAFLRDWFDEEIAAGVTGVDATLELTGPTTGLTDVSLSTENLLFEEKTALGLPVKIHLENPLLGSNCYVGWESDPVQIDFTTGTSGALKGTAGEAEFSDGFTVTTIPGGKLVNGTFATPAAEGCGGIFSFFIDGLVNEILGTPSASGKSSAVLEGVFKSGVAKFVKASEKQ